MNRRSVSQFDRSSHVEHTCALEFDPILSQTADDHTASWRRRIGAKSTTDPDQFPLQIKSIINLSSALTMERRMLLDVPAPMGEAFS
jgi:hypothetical protein